VRESNPRLPDDESGALTTELTVSYVAVSEPIHGTDSTELLRVACTPLDERHQGTLLTKDAGGSRTHLNRVAAGRLANWLPRRS
jgi:hypothetical protein